MSKLGEGSTPGPWKHTDRTPYIVGPIYKVQNGSQIDIHWRDFRVNREITIASNLTNEQAADEIVTSFNKAPLLIEARDELQRYHVVIQAHFATLSTIEGRTALAMMNRMRALLAKLEAE